MQWDAPRIAYEIMREWTRARTDNPGGGWPAPGKRWTDLTPPERGDVLLALGAQARVALQLGREHAWMEWEAPLRAHVDLTRGLCAQAQQHLEALLLGQDGWKAPECGHCAAVTATLLCALTHAVYRALGFEPSQILAGQSPAGGL